MADVNEIRAFGEALRAKHAVSASSALKVLRSRAAAGARVAPALMEEAGQAAASGARSTPSWMRRLTLDAGDSARAAGKVRTLASRMGMGAERQALLNRSREFDSAVAKAPAGLVGPGHGMMEQVYTPGGAEFMAGKIPINQARTMNPATTHVVHAPTEGATRVGKRKKL